MRHLMGLVLASGILLGSASSSEAQFSISIGSPYAGQGFSMGSGYGSGYGYSGYGLNTTSYGVGYPNYAAFGATAYRPYVSGGYPVAGYGVSPVYGSGYSSYGYSSGYRGYAPMGGYGYGYGMRSYNRGFGGRGGLFR